MMRLSNKLRKNGFWAAVVVILAAGCSEESWDWLGDRSARSNDRQVTKARKPSNEPAVAAADRPAAPKPARGDDPKSKEVDEKVDRYVRSMQNTNTYDPNYESNDFHAKMRRQSDPERAARIRQTATMSREGGAPGDPSRPAPGSSPTAARVQPASPKTVDSTLLEVETPSTMMKAAPEKSDNPADEKSKSETNAQANESDSKPMMKSDGGTTGSTVASNEPVTKAPVLTEVKVEAGGPVEPPPQKTEPDRPVANPSVAPVIIDSFQKRLDEQEALVGKDANNVEEQFKLRLLYLADGQDDKAMAAAPGMNLETSEIMLAQLRALLAARSSAQKDAAAWANRQLEAIEQLRNLIRARANLSVPRVALCKEILQFGQFTPFEPAEFKAGRPNKVALYIEVDNYSMERTSSGMYRVLLSLRQSLHKKSGEEIWNKKDENIEDLSRRPRRDFYLAVEHVVPKTLEPGEYLFKVEVEDVLAGKLNGNSADFKLVP